MFFKLNELENLTEEFTWLKQEFRNTENVVTKENFPCTFGVQGYKRQLHYLSALNYPYDPKELSNDIECYLNTIKSMNIKESGLAGLLVYFQPLGKMNIKAKQFLSWNLLSKMKKMCDSTNDGNHNDPNDDNYSFRFKNELWFINFSSNSYLNRKSRNLNTFLTLALQTFSKSNAFFKADNKIKARAQRTVRNLAMKFDGCPVHSGLGPIIGEEKFSPVKLSYYIGDTNDEPSFQPWLYKEYLPQKVVIDSDIITNSTIEEFDKFNQLSKPFDLVVLGKLKEELNVPILSENELMKYKGHNILFVSSKRETLIKYKGIIHICLIGKNKTPMNDCFSIEYFNDLLALYK